MNQDRLHLTNFNVDCILGFAQRERVSPQKVVIDLSMFFSAVTAAESGRLEESIDYVRTLGEIRFLMEHGKFILIETAAETLARFLLCAPGPDAPRAPVDSVRLKISKPEALVELTPALEITRSTTVLKKEESRFGTAEQITTVPDCSVYRLSLKPGGKFVCRSADHVQSELVLGSNLHVQGIETAAGTAFTWEANTPRVYENRSAVPQTLLRISHPASAFWSTLVDEPEPQLVASGTAYYSPVMAEYLTSPRPI